MLTSLLDVRPGQFQFLQRAAILALQALY